MQENFMQLIEHYFIISRQVQHTTDRNEHGTNVHQLIDRE